jgi:hypothetical protein
VFSVLSASLTEADVDVDKIPELIASLAELDVGGNKALTVPTQITRGPTASPTPFAEKVTIGSGRIDPQGEQPVIGGIYPETLPSGGGVSVTLRGKNLGRVGGMVVKSQNGAETSINDNELIFTPSSTFSGQVEVTFPISALSETGYHLVSFTTPTSEFRSYFTIFVAVPKEREVCSLQGKWKWDDQAQVCVDCPNGGYCPGGGRVWPIAGYAHIYIHSIRTFRFFSSPPPSLADINNTSIAIVQALGD